MYDIESINNARIIYYRLFSSLFSFIDLESDYTFIKDTVSYLEKKPIEENSSNALKEMNSFLLENSLNTLKEENNELFFSPSTTFIPLTASFYDEGRDDGKKRLEMIDFLLESNFRKNNLTFEQSEDEISFILKFLENLIEENKSLQINNLFKETFENILNNFVDEFIDNIYNHESSVFYKNVVILFKVFIEMERNLLSIKTVNKKISEERKTTVFDNNNKEFKKRAKRNFSELTSL